MKPTGKAALALLLLAALGLLAGASSCGVPARAGGPAMPPEPEPQRTAGTEARDGAPQGKSRGREAPRWTWTVLRSSGTPSVTDVLSFLGGVETIRRLAPAPEPLASAPEALGEVVDHRFPKKTRPRLPDGSLLSSRMRECGYAPIDAGTVAELAQQAAPLFGLKIPESVLAALRGDFYLLEEGRQVWAIVNVVDERIKVTTLARLEMTVAAGRLELAAPVPFLDVRAYLADFAEREGCP